MTHSKFWTVFLIFALIINVFAVVLQMVSGDPSLGWIAVNSLCAGSLGVLLLLRN